MKYLLGSLSALLIGGSLIAAQHHGSTPHVVPHVPHAPHGYHTHPINHSNPHFRQAGVVRNSWGYSYRGYRWNFFRYHRYFSAYGTHLFWNPYASSWYYWCQPDTAWYPITYVPYGVYYWANSPDLQNYDPNAVPNPPEPVPAPIPVLPQPPAPPTPQYYNGIMVPSNLTDYNGPQYLIPRHR